MTIKYVAHTAWRNSAYDAYASNKRYGGTAVLWTFLTVLALSICIIAVAYNWRSVSWLTNYWSASQTMEPVSTKSDAGLDTGRKSDSNGLRLDNSQAAAGQP